MGKVKGFVYEKKKNVECSMLLWKILFKLSCSE